MKILAFDTSTAACSAALTIDGEIRQQFQIAPQRHAELLLTMVEDLLNEAGIKLNQLDALAFGCGPGSFIGVRTATGVAQGLAFGADLPVIPVSSLQILAQTAYLQTQESRLLCGWDARMNAIYWGAYCLGQENILLPIQADALSAPDQIILTDAEIGSAVGNAWEIYQDSLAPAFSKNCSKVLSSIFPEAQALAVIADVFYRQGKLIDALQAQPVYLREQVTLALNKSL